MAAIGNLSLAITAPSPPFRLAVPSRRTLNLRCWLFSRKHENVGDPPSSRIESEARDKNVVDESVFSSEKELDVNSSDVWKLFNDAQRNILYLNNQRLKAVDELDAIRREKHLLIKKLEQLEAEKKADVVKDPGTLWELFLRIDTMVLSGMINSEEATHLRKVIVNYQISIHDAFYEIQHKKDIELLSELHHFSEKITRYTIADNGALQEFRKTEFEFDSYFGGCWHKNRVWTGVLYGIGVTLVEPLNNATFFNRNNIYGYPDDFERFTYFSRASMDYLVKTGKQPDVLHIHNWETAIIGPLFWDIFVHQGLAGTRVLCTCHDLTSQCLEQPEKLALCGLNPSQLHRPDRMQDNDKPDLINVLKGGIVYSNKVVLMPSFLSKDKIFHSLSHGLEPTLAIHKEKMLIAPYGYDNAVWDPSLDKFLPAKYSADNIEGKATCKDELRHHLGFQRPSSAVVGCIYSGSSDFDLLSLKLAIMHCLRRSCQCVLLGPKLPALDAILQAFQDESMDEDVKFIADYDESLLHLVLAGTDIMLCCTFHDPVLQIPLKAVKYGSAPILMDSGIDELRKSEWHEVGYGSRDDRPSGLHELASASFSQYILSTYANMTLSQALDEILNEPSKWSRRIREGMSRDFSWDAECCDIHCAAYTSIKNL
ncbi:UDP-Glycosyltransferase/glycogen phosphorylase protein [Dioscorea alata]|uniref:UDP-Glycosyltransferase/glycogen phosphorylase protein n=1 Tax=Dioscorea alata TaxID=55571 RepID=A0ACB7V8R4_DIOAL|nr:UDP-Glycosyltransferase/glycogen phosphorylase protein [Dioscorea alata]